MPSSLLKFEKKLSVKIGGRRYPVVKIGNQLWLAENLDYKFLINGTQIPVGLNETPFSPAAWYYNNDETRYGVNGKKYGLLYNGFARNYIMENERQLFPKGWHLPSLAEFNTLVNFIGSNAGKKLKSSKDDWIYRGTDDYGFNALPAGYRRTTFTGVSTYTSFWVTDNTPSTHSEPNLPKAKYLDDSNSLKEDYWHTQYSYGSIRLVKNLT
ncbi:MAG: FISUMP domain-containing protein [Methanosphaera sp.]|nr:FISUMP domain-containing protein [Methanosphaera sp.]